MRADAMLDKGDLDGYAVWRRILRAAGELLSKERLVGMTVQWRRAASPEHQDRLIPPLLSFLARRS